MIELRRHVERIVRPIRASNWRKVRMREELLAHLASIYEDELASHQDDQALALAAAVERFGEPSALRAELQATVPHVERVLCFPLPVVNSRFRRRPGETIVDYVRRTAVSATLVHALTWLIFVGVLAIISPRRAREAQPGAIRLLIATYVVAFPLLVYGPILLCDQATRAWRRMRDASASDSRRAGLLAAGAFGAIMAIYAGATLIFLTLLCRATMIPIVTDFWFWCITAVASLIGLPITLLQMRDLRRWELWEGLALDEVSASDETVAGA
jgi:hypothetical protein